MTDNGYVYVLMNPSMQNLVKIGKTVGKPEERAKELSTTGVSTPFVVVYDCYFESCTEAEIFVHSFLENKGFSVSTKREFFEIPIKDAIDSVMKAKEHFGEFRKIDLQNIEDLDENFAEEDDVYNPDYENEEVSELLDKALKYQYGLGEEFKDIDEAMKCYLKAIKLGSISACQDLASCYEEKKDIDKAMKYFKEGVKRGDSSCFWRMAMIFENLENIDNARKSWKKYFSSTEVPTEHIASFYLKFALVNGDGIEYLEKMKNIKEEVITTFKKGGYMATIIKDDQSYSVGEDFLEFLEDNI